jgi:hypothetical protein
VQSCEERKVKQGAEQQVPRAEQMTKKRKKWVRVCRGGCFFDRNSITNLFIIYDWLAEINMFISLIKSGMIKFPLFKDENACLTEALPNKDGEGTQCKQDEEDDGRPYVELVCFHHRFRRLRCRLHHLAQYVYC